MCEGGGGVEERGRFVPDLSMRQSVRIVLDVFLLGMTD